MKNRRVAAYLGIALFAIAATGCENKDEKLPVFNEKTADTEFTDDENEGGGDSPTDDAGISGEGTDDASGGAVLSPNNEAANGDEVHGKSEELQGNVRSIEEDSFVLSQAFQEGEDILVSPVEGSEDQVMVTVSVSKDTQYEVKTVKNGGVNGDADVETLEGAFADLEEGAAVNILGYYAGEAFTAEKVIIYRFV